MSAQRERDGQESEHRENNQTLMECQPPELTEPDSRFQGQVRSLLYFCLLPQEHHIVSSFLWTQGIEFYDDKGTGASYPGAVSHILKLAFGGKRGKRSTNENILRSLLVGALWNHPPPPPRPAIPPKEAEN